jgi:hypothetical protein
VTEVDVLWQAIPGELAWDWVSFSWCEPVVVFIPSQFEYVVRVEPAIYLGGVRGNGIVEWVLWNLLEDEVLACCGDIGGCGDIG